MLYILSRWFLFYGNDCRHFESDQSQSASYDRIGKALLKVYEMVYWNILPSFHLVEKRQPMENHKTEAMTHSTTRPEHSS